MCLPDTLSWPIILCEHSIVLEIENWHILKKTLGRLDETLN